MKKLAITTPLIAASLLTICSIDTSAESFQSEQNASFTFNPTMTVSISSDDISIDHLMPGSYADSDTVTITVSSNATGGYNLAATVGNNIYNYDSVKHTNGTDAFANLTSNKESLSAFSDNTWGYAYSNDSGSTWISGNTGSTSIGYNGLPLCTEETPAACNGVQIIDANINGSTTIDFKVGAKASTSQPAGDYSNVINFVGVSKPNPEPPTPAPAPGECTDTATCMQTMTSCPTTATTVTDSRDGEQYLVQQLADGNCWMLDNLRLGGSSTIDLTPADTNIASNWTLPASGTVCLNYDSCTGTSGATGTGYTVPAINADYKNNTTTSYGAGSGKIGNYYNYCSASAGTYCYAGGSGTGNAEHDICPAGWRMPTGGNSGEYNTLATAYNDNYTATDPASLQYNLSTPLSGLFRNGSAGYQDSYGHFWSSTMDDGNNMHFLYVGSVIANPTTGGSRYTGNSVRCLLGS